METCRSTGAITEVFSVLRASSNLRKVAIGKSWKAGMIRSMIVAMAYELWGERNRRIFEKIMKQPSDIAREILEKK
ncbi:hypothetical protein AKJ16_DCAP00284 [Drosera capensis]